MSVTHTSPASAKIELFRALFRGREEVYPRRFESAKSGKAGYSPVCGNEWVRGVCEKPRIKCNDCPHQRRLPVTDDVVRCHLSGADDRRRDFVAGVYGSPALPRQRGFRRPETPLNNIKFINKNKYLQLYSHIGVLAPGVRDG